MTTRGAPAVGGAALLAGAVYTLTSAPGIQLWDTAELSAAAYRLGPSHPPGQPLYSILGKLATLLPCGSIAFRANLLSAASAAVAVWLAGRLALAWADRAPGGSRHAGLLAALAMAASGPLVNQATRAEVYSPALAVFLLAALLVTRAVLDGEGRAPSGGGMHPTRALAAAGLCTGLAATLHPAAGLSAGIAGLVAVATLRPRLLARWRVWALTLASIVLGAAPLALIALRCRGDLEPCWENDLTPARFYRYITGAPYRQNLQTGSAAYATVVAAAQFTALRAGLLAPAVVLAAAIAAARRREARPVLAIGAGIGVPFAFLVMQPFHPDNPDTQGYLLPALALLLVAAPVGALSLVPGRRAVGMTLAVAATAASVWLGDAAASLRPRAHLGGDIGQHALGEPLPRALVMACTDAVFFAMHYGQLVEGQRPDVVLLASGLAQQWSDAARRRPEISLERATPEGPGDAKTRLARGALALLAGTIPRWVEDPLLDVGRARATGVLFRLDPSTSAGGRQVVSPTPTAFPAALARELARRRSQYGDGSESVIRLLRLRRAFDREAHGELAAAVEELLAGLWEDRAALEGRLADFTPQSPPRGRPLTPLGGESWVIDAGALRAALARVLYRGGRTDLAVAVLERDFRAGQELAVLVLAEIELREGRAAEAEELYRAFAEAHPERRGYALVGLALVRAAEGDRAGAERILGRVRAGDDEVLEVWARDVARLVIPAIREPGG